MNAGKLVLRPLEVGDVERFRAAVEEFLHDDPAWGFAFDYDVNGDFTAYVEKLRRWSRGMDLPERFVPNSFLIGVVDGVVVGRVSIRHELNDFLRQIGGHIGYGVVPSQRLRGYATGMLRLSLPICAAMGLSRVLVTCDQDNIGSRKVIEACGGVFEGITDRPDLKVPKRRYWIETGSRTADAPPAEG